MNISHNNNQSTPKISVQRQDITPETVFSVRAASNAVISPDGTKIAFLVGEWLPEQDKYRNRLWMVDTTGGVPQPMTKGSRKDSAPAWSPDSRTLAFASKVDSEKGNHPQLYLKDVQTGEERQVCALPMELAMFPGLQMANTSPFVQSKVIRHHKIRRSNTTVRDAIHACGR
ncbi:TolB family protein [Dictyobacter kobayashii]|uniref:Dipeptidylpeptidase IV N-terminal domain-containing protein n=1 Tax=Dictyobacter kobayashii TaxID=2014872 RepID=A0A402AX28_9CHLR|nr:PD40 domain-containing protein [Dictyobacter kobayashii]GCE23656.1 hypothetical protein KDK_74560 [Dictyobacter kobayashii]